MISIELARKLKDAGFKWETDVGDFYWAEKCDGTEGRLCINQDKGNGFYHHIITTWIPRLDQMLKEIEKRGEKWELSGNNGRYIAYVGYCPSGFAVSGNTVEDAVAKILLLLLEQEASHDTTSLQD